MSTRNRVTAGLGLVSALLIAACAQEPPYFGPAGPDHSTGYTDQQIDRTHFRVSYAGDSSTPRTTVEDFLLLRSAQVALQAGYPSFDFDTRDTNAKTRYYSTFAGWPGWRGRGWYRWGPPMDGDAYTVPITRYEAYAEIVLLTDEEAKKEPRALNAQDVVAHLGPMAVPPPPPH